MTKPDLSRQAIIPSGSTASFDGSINIGEKLLVQDVEFVISGITSGQTLVYDSNLNKLIPTSIDLNASSTLSGMTDVNFTTLVSGDTIVWNSTTNKWENNNIVLNTDSIINTSTVTGSTTTNALDNLNTNKADLVAGKVPSSQLPSYVDDVIEGYYYTSVFYEDSGHTISISGETGKIYIDLPTNFSYRWSGSVYIQISSTALSGTPNRITVTTGDTIDIASTYTGQTSIDTVGGITTGSWSGTPINDTYISSASTWNAKQNQLNGNGFVRATGTTISYLSGTTNQFVKADGSLDSTSYGGIKFTPNTYWVDPTNGSDSTGTYGREDLPYATLQYVWDLIPNGNTTDITIFIKGDYLATTHAIYEPTFAKHNIRFTFLNEVTYSVNSTTDSRPLFSFYIACNNLTFNVPSFTMTKQGGFIYAFGSEGHVYNFTNVTALTGIDVSTTNNSWFINGSAISNTYCSLSVDKLNISITNDSNNLKNTNAFFILQNAIVNINEVRITGGATVSDSKFYLFASYCKNIYIKRFYSDITYTNVTDFKVVLGGTINILIDDFSTASNGSTRKSFALFENTISRLKFGVFSSLCYQPLLGDNNCSFLDLGRCTTNGTINGSSTSGYFSGQIVFDSVNITGLSSDDYGFFLLKEGSSLTGGQIKYDRNSSVGTGRAIINIYSISTSKYISLNFELINTNQNTTGRVFKPILYIGNLNKIICKNLVVSSNTDTTNDTLASWLQPYGDNTSYSITVEGTVLTNYVKTITNFTNNADTTIITNYAG